MILPEDQTPVAKGDLKCGTNANAHVAAMLARMGLSEKGFPSKPPGKDPERFGVRGEGCTLAA